MLSFVVPCYNEEKRILNTITQIEEACEKLIIKDYKILIVDDCSSDNSREVIENEIKNKSYLKYCKNEKNLGFGGAVKTGLNLLDDDYLMWLPGDDAHPASQIIKILEIFIKNKNKNFDIVSTFYSRKSKRNYFRELFTKSYTPLLNFLFGLKIPYYNGLSIIKKTSINKISIKTNSHCWQVELWVKLSNLKNFNFMFIETEVFDPSRKAAAFKFANSIKVIYNIQRLFLISIKNKIFKFF